MLSRGITLKITLTISLISYKKILFSRTAAPKGTIFSMEVNISLKSLLCNKLLYSIAISTDDISQ